MAIPTKIKSEDNSIRIGELYMRRCIRPKQRKSEFQSNLKDEVYIGIWNGDSTELNLDELNELRMFLNETVMKMTFKNIPNGS